MSPLELLLARLPGARRTAPDTYIASSPTRNERTPSVTIRELPDGRVLIHDFGGDSVDDLLAAIGLTTANLFPTKLTGSPPMRKGGLLGASQALNLLHDEAQLIALAGSNVAHGVVLTEVDLDRVLQAAGRIAYLRDEAMA